MGYNQHQSFFLRDRWLGKGLRALDQNPRIFFEDDAFEKLGLGKNMVKSLQHWLIAVQAATSEGIGKKRILQMTPFGKWVLEADPSLKYFDTVAMLHYNITTSDEPSTTWYWFFNQYQETITSKENLTEELNAFVQERETRVVAENSIMRDADCLVRMYASDEMHDDPEEVIASPFARLKLIEEKRDVVTKRELRIPDNNLLFVKYALAKYSAEHDQYEISLDEFVSKEKLLGRVYNLSRSTIVKLLTDLVTDHEYPIQFTRTNNLDVVKLPKVDPLELLYT